MRMKRPRGSILWADQALDCASSGTGMHLESRLAMRGERGRGRRIAQQSICGLREFIEPLHLPRAVVSQQQIDERREVFHMRAEEHGLAGKDRLGGILTTFSEEALSDDHERGEVLPGGELAGAVDEQTGRGIHLRSRIGAPGGFQAELTKVRVDIRVSL